MNVTRYSRCVLILLLVFVFTVACEGPENDAISKNHVVLDGEDNMRDLGGFVGEGGRTVAYGKLFRSGELSELTPEDLVVLSEMELAHVIDLRRTRERNRLPDNLPEGVAVYHLPLLPDIFGSGDLKGQPLEAFIHWYMTSIYVNITDLKIQSWTAIFDLLEKGEGALWHCTQGKDRAGMTAALVLLSLGVDKADVMEDFMMSNVYLAESMEKKIRLGNLILGEEGEALLEPILGVEQGYLMSFFETIDRDYGGIEAFLALLDVDVEAMRNHYLVSP